MRVCIPPSLLEVIVEGGFVGGALALVCGLIECCHFLHKTDATGGCLRNTHCHTRYHILWSRHSRSTTPAKILVAEVAPLATIGVQAHSLFERDYLSCEQQVVDLPCVPVPVAPAILMEESDHKLGVL